MPNLLVLSGSGTSAGKVGGPTMSDLWKNTVLDPEGTVTQKAKEVFDLIEFTSENIEFGNIEALLTRCEAYLLVKSNGLVGDFVQNVRDKTLTMCTEFLVDKSSHEYMDDKLEAHCTFLHRLSRRRVRDPRLRIFTTNYDLCFERAAALQRLICVNGFSYAFPRVYDPSYFSFDFVRRSQSSTGMGDYLEGVFQLMKLHGSVNWVRRSDGSIEELASPSASEVCLIYPASGKYHQSYVQPHLELISQYLSGLREPNTCVIVVGYGFNDDHLSEPILAAAKTNPRLKLIIVDIKAAETIGGNATPINKYWKDLDVLSKRGEDIWFINAPFAEFVQMIPDLKTLSPAQQLEKTIVDIGRQQ